MKKLPHPRRLLSGVLKQGVMSLLALIAGLAVCGPAARAATYHVAQQQAGASDNHPGTAAAPWKTISQAARTLQPGDTAIHAGTYREWVQPARSGGADRPIVYRAAEGEKVVLTGADIITGWAPAREHVWKKEPWNYTFFTHPNDARHHLIGRCEQVIVDGKLLKQVENPKDMAAGTFSADTAKKVLYAWLPGGDDPAKHLVEASVRSLCFGVGGLGTAKSPATGSSSTA